MICFIDKQGESYKAILRYLRILTSLPLKPSQYIVYNSYTIVAYMFFYNFLSVICDTKK